MSAHYSQPLVAYSVDHGELLEIPLPLAELRKQDRVGFAWFSDTVIVYAKTDDDIACRNVLEAVGWLLFATMCTRTRIRAGIAYGKFFVDPANEIHIGSALVEAYELEQAQQWSGAALTVNAARRIPKRNTSGERYQWWVCDYPIPLKPDSDVENSGYAVDWTQAIHEKMELLWSLKQPEPSPEDYRERKSVCEKWNNTVKFHREVCTSCFPSNKERDPLKVL